MSKPKKQDPPSHVGIEVLGVKFEGPLGFVIAVAAIALPLAVWWNWKPICEHLHLGTPPAEEKPARHNDPARRYLTDLCAFGRIVRCVAEGECVSPAGHGLGFSPDLSSKEATELSCRTACRARVAGEPQIYDRCDS